MDRINARFLRYPDEEKYFKYLYSKFFDIGIINHIIRVSGSTLQIPKNYMEIEHYETIKVTKKNFTTLYWIFREIMDVLGINDGMIGLNIIHPKMFDKTSFLKRIFIQHKGYTINLHPKVLNILNEDELRFFLAREVGHIIFNHYPLMVAYNDVIKVRNEEKRNINYISYATLERLYNFWQILSELTADRIGTIFVKEKKTPLKTILKVEYGLDDKHLKGDLEEIINQVGYGPSGIYEIYLQIRKMPTIEMRFFAIKTFMESTAYKIIKSGLKPKEDESIKKIREWILNLYQHKNTIRFLEKQFVVYLLYTLFRVTGGVGEKERLFLKAYMFNYDFFGDYPRKYMKKLDSQTIEQLIRGITQAIVLVLKMAYPVSVTNSFEEAIEYLLLSGRINRDAFYIIREVGASIGNERPFFETMLLEMMKKYYIPEIGKNRNLSSRSSGKKKKRKANDRKKQSSQ